MQETTSSSKVSRRVLRPHFPQHSPQEMKNDLKNLKETSFFCGKMEEEKSFECLEYSLYNDPSQAAIAG